MNYQYGGRFRPTGMPHGPVTATPVRTPEPRVMPEAAPCPSNLLGVAPTEGCAVSSLAMVYSPKQAFRCLYEPMQGLARGTLFSELDKPFKGSRC